MPTLHELPKLVPLDKSIVEYLGRNKSKCGYCKHSNMAGTRGRHSYDLEALRLTPLDYQAMLDWGWRRGGTYCYKIINNDTCCPNFTISCKALDFKLSSRSMRRCIRRFNSFIMTGEPRSTCDQLIYPANALPNQAISTRSNFKQIEASCKARDRRFARACYRYQKRFGGPIEDAAEKVREKWRRISIARGNTEPKKLVLEDLLYPTTNCEPKLKLTIELVHVDSSKSIRDRDEELNVLQKYQLKIHKEQADEWTYERYTEFLIDTPILDERLRDFEHTSGIDQHQTDTQSRTKHVPLDNNISIQDHCLFQAPPLPTHYGTYHCVYRLDSKVIAVGVLDILPKCISTVYFFYDPEYGFLNLGTYSALMEISLVRRLANQYRGSGDCKLIHYYLGLYVHKCSKMRYKVEYKPSFLLCDETKEYVSTEVALSKLEPGIDYAVFSDQARHRERTELNFSLTDLHKGFILAPITGSSLIDVSFSGYIYWMRQHVGCLEANIFIDRVLTPLLRTLGRDLLLNLVLKVYGVHKVLVSLAQRPIVTSDESGDSEES